MVQTTKLELPLIAAAQAQKHVTHNEAILRLDGLCQMQAVSYTVSAQPASPADGDLYLLPAGKTGTAWGAAANHAVAHYYDGVWHFYAPRTGWFAFITDTSRLVYYNGSQWADVLTPSGASAADGTVSAPGFAFSADTNTGIYRIGADNPALAVGASKLVDWKAAGSTQPLQPSFNAYVGSSVTNVTGDGTDYQLIPGTEFFDQGGNFNTSTGVFTAPVTGVYLFGGAALIYDLGSGHTIGWIMLTASGANYYGSGCNPYAVRRSDGYAGLILPPTLVKMTANDTAVLKVHVAGSTKTVDVYGATGQGNSYFTGALMF